MFLGLYNPLTAIIAMLESDLIQLLCWCFGGYLALGRSLSRAEDLAAEHIGRGLPPAPGMPTCNLDLQITSSANLIFLYLRPLNCPLLAV